MSAAVEPAGPPPKPVRMLSRWWHWERSSGKFLVISIAVHLLFGGVAAILVVQRYQAARKLTFKGGPPSPNPSTRALEHKVQLAKKQSSMSAPAAARKITTTGLSKVTLPEMPAMPKLAAPPVKMAGAGGTDVGFSAGGTTSSNAGGAGGAAVPFFGFTAAKGGGALVGKFYDLKQFKNQNPSKLDEQKGYPGEIAKFVNSGWNEANLQKYFVAPHPLYTTQIFIPKINAVQGPRAVGLGVQPKMWVIHYKGTVVPTESGTFRFVGVADDVLIVRFNGRVVLDCGSMNPTGHGPQKFYTTAGLQIEKRQGMEWYKGLGRGEPFQVNGGESYPMEVLIGEWSGIDFKAWLLIEKDGVQYEKDANGNPILPVFKLAASTIPNPVGEAPKIDKEGPVWKAEKPKETE